MRLIPDKHRRRSGCLSVSEFARSAGQRPGAGFFDGSAKKMKSMKNQRKTPKSHFKGLGFNTQHYFCFMANNRFMTRCPGPSQQPAKKALWLFEASSAAFGSFVFSGKENEP